MVTTVQTATMTETMTDLVTMTDTVTNVVPTTIVSVWKQTETMDSVRLFCIHKRPALIPLQTKTVVNTVTSTMVENKTYLQTTTYVSTATATQTVSETGLSDCLGQVNWACVDTL